ncbi:MAG: lyase family protein [Ferroplasma sp.]
MKIWSGSAAPESGNDSYKIMLNKDVAVDSYLIKYELLSLMAYNLDIYRKNIIKKEDAAITLKALLKLYQSDIKLNPDLEDVHGNIENLIIKETGGSGKNVRMFLSRNEQVHTDVALFLRDLLIEYEDTLYKTIEKLGGITENGVMPGYTHYRQGMPVTYRTYIDFIENIFVYNFNSIHGMVEELNELPLGYGSGFGSMSDVNFKDVASYLGMAHNIKNPLFSFMMYTDNYMKIMSIINSFLIDISRIFQDLIIFSGDEMKIVELPSGFVTGSSLMPNKVNPDFLEIFQGYAARSISLMNLIYSAVINKTTGYHRDFQVIKDEVIPFLVELHGIINGFPELFSKLKFNSERSEKILGNSIYATYNSKLEFENSRDWKEAYSSSGEKIRNGIPLKSYMPEDTISFNNFDSIKTIVDNDARNSENGKAELIDMVKGIFNFK